MPAAIDIGSNTVRMLVGSCATSEVVKPQLYRQEITRLAGGCTQENGLAPGSMERTLAVIADFAQELQRMGIADPRVVGTAALRRAVNAQHFINLVKIRTRLSVEIISGREEARLSAQGVLTVLDPRPETALIFDLGGGSTEISFCQQRQVLSSASYPLGVVQMVEEYPSIEPRRIFIQDMIVKMATDLLHAGLSPLQLQGCALIGTAGTMTTLAAIKLRLKTYAPARINNQRLSTAWLEKTLQKVQSLRRAELLELPGLEPGREDLIAPGLEFVSALCRYFSQPTVCVSDAGLLEGILLDSSRHSPD